MTDLMIDLTTRYLGKTLCSPLVCSASPLCEDVGALRRMEDAAAGATEPLRVPQASRQRRGCSGRGE